MNRWIADIRESEYEVWESDIYAQTREEVIRKGLDEAKEQGVEVFRIGYIVDESEPRLDVEDIIERLSDKVYYELGEVADNYLQEITDKEFEELDKGLNDVFEKWTRKYNKKLSCFKVIKEELITVK